MHKSILTIITLMLSTLCWANDIEVWKAKPYNEKDYDKAYDTYIRYFDSGLDKYDEMVSIADSMYKAGERTGNYPVQINALMMRCQAYSLKEDLDGILEIHKQAMELARQNQHSHLYFSMYYSYCSYLRDKSKVDAFLATKDLIAEAQKIGNDNGLRNGHLLLGNFQLYDRQDAHLALDEFKYVEQLCKKNNNKLGSFLVDLYAEMAQACLSIRNYPEAKKYLDKMRTVGGYGDEYTTTSYYLTYFSYAEKVGTAEEVDEIYHKYFDTSGIRMRYNDDALLSFKMRWLTKTGRYNEALATAPLLNDMKSRYACLVDVYKGLGRYKEALECQQHLEEINDSILHEISTTDIAIMNAQMHNSELREENEHAISQRNKTIFLFTIVILALIIMGVTIMHQRQKSANRKLQKANDVKASFIQSMSHELRTPINHIYGFTQVLADKNIELDEKTREDTLKAVSAGAESLTHIIDDVIQLAALDSETEKPQISEISVETLVNDALDTIKPATDEVAIKTSFDIAPSYLLNTNADMVQHALRNLLDNAVKFTSKGEICLSVRQANKGLNKYVEFVVSDTGIGIPEAEQERIFERFYKVDKFTPGTGLGLSVCRVIANILKGSISIDKSYTTGARFIFSIPE